MDPRIGRAVDYINRHFRTKIRLDHLSRNSGLSTQHFVYLFKREIGETFKPYLKRLRVRKSQELLQDPYLSITEVCLGVGYHDLTNFERDFRRFTNMTPREYRRGLAAAPRVPLAALAADPALAPGNSE